jgi:hypothetical protein
MSGSHGDAPARGALCSGVDGKVDQRGHQRPAQGGHNGQRRVPSGGEFAHQHLALYLQPHDEKEDGHKPVVDPVGEVLGYGEVTHTHVELGVPQRGVALPPRRIGPSQCDYDGGYQDDAAGGLLVGEVLEGAYDPLHRRSLSRYAHVANRTRVVTERPSRRRLFTHLRGRKILGRSYPICCISDSWRPEYSAWRSCEVNNQTTTCRDGE